MSGLGLGLGLMNIILDANSRIEILTIGIWFAMWKRHVEKIQDFLGKMKL